MDLYLSLHGCCSRRIGQLRHHASRPLGIQCPGIRHSLLRNQAPAQNTKTTPTPTSLLVRSRGNLTRAKPFYFPSILSSVPLFSSIYQNSPFANTLCKTQYSPTLILQVCAGKCQPPVKGPQCQRPQKALGLLFSRWGLVESLRTRYGAKC